MTAGPEEIAFAVERLRAGRLVAFPTETVYGLGANALDEAAIARVFALKNRPATNPLIVHVSGIDMARALTTDWTRRAQRLAEAFWPGPLTLVLPKAPHVPHAVTAGGPTVALRGPAHPLTLALIEAFGGPLVGPSANPSGSISPTAAEHVQSAFNEDDVYVLNGGPCRAGIESTVVFAGEGPVRVLRPGIVGIEAIAEALDEPLDEPQSEIVGPHEQNSADGAIAQSPGLLPRHYAPRTPCVVVTRHEIEQAGPHDVVMMFEGDLAELRCKAVVLMPREASAYAARLYAALHEADRAGGARLLIERPPEAGSAPAETAIWRAIADRLGRASG